MLRAKRAENGEGRRGSPRGLQLCLFMSIHGIFLYVVGGFQQLEREEGGEAKQTAPALLRLCHLRATALWGAVWGGVPWGSAPGGGGETLRPSAAFPARGSGGTFGVGGGGGERRGGDTAGEHRGGDTAGGGTYCSLRPQHGAGGKRGQRGDVGPVGPTCPSPRRCLAASSSCVPSLRQITEAPPALIPTERGLNGSPGPPLLPRLPISAQRQRGPTGRPVARGRRTQRTAPLPPGTATAATPPRGLGTGGHRRGAGGAQTWVPPERGGKGAEGLCGPPSPRTPPGFPACAEGTFDR